MCVNCRHPRTLTHTGSQRKHQGDTRAYDAPRTKKKKKERKRKKKQQEKKKKKKAHEVEKSRQEAPVHIQNKTEEEEKVSGYDTAKLVTEGDRPKKKKKRKLR